MSSTFREDQLEGIWAVDFRPKTLDEIILPARLKNKFNNYITDKSIPNLLLVSPNPGTGKTTIAKILISSLESDVLFINGSQDNGIDVLRNTISRFAENSSLYGNKKIVFIDESDGISINLQKAMRMFMEDYANTVRFILTANYKDIFIEPFLSRLSVVDFELQQNEMIDMMKEFMNRASSILTEKEIEFEPKVLATIIKDNFPDYRSIWNSLQEVYDTFGSINQVSTMNKKTIDMIIDAINEKDISKIRNLMKEMKDINYVTIYSYLFKRIEEIKIDMKIVALNLAIYQDKSNKSCDRSLTFLGCIADMLLSDLEN